jgi:hypothetical protein
MFSPVLEKELGEIFGMINDPKMVTDDNAENKENKTIHEKINRTLLLEFNSQRLSSANLFSIKESGCWSAIINEVLLPRINAVKQKHEQKREHVESLLRSNRPTTMENDMFLFIDFIKTVNELLNVCGSTYLVLYF